MSIPHSLEITWESTSTPGNKSTKHKAHAGLPGTKGPSESSDWTNCSKVKMMRTVVPNHVTCMILTEMASLVVFKINLDRQRGRGKERN